MSKAINNARYNMAANKSGNSKRVITIANHIDGLLKLVDGSLDDMTVRDQVVDSMWQLYALVEVRGLDDAHHNENLPCDDRQSFAPNASRGAQGVQFHAGRKQADARGFTDKDRWLRIMPDSIYPDPEDQYALLAGAEKMTRGEPNIMAQIEYPKATKARLNSSPDSHLSGIELSIRDDMPVMQVTNPIVDKTTMGKVTMSHFDSRVTVGYPVNSVSLPVKPEPLKGRALTAHNKLINSMSDKLKAERLTATCNRLLVENDRAVAGDLARNSIILLCREILATE